MTSNTNSSDNTARTYAALSGLILSLLNLGFVIYKGFNPTLEVPIDKLRIDPDALELHNPAINKPLALCTHEFSPEDIQIWTRNMDGTGFWLNPPQGTELVLVLDELSWWGNEACENLKLGNTDYDIKSYEYNPDDREGVVSYKMEN